MSIYYDRREFVKKAALSAAGIGLMGSYGFSASKRVAANDTIRVAVIGTNSRGAALAGGFARTPGVEVLFICDVDDSAALKGYNAVMEAGQSSEPKIIRDFRTILDEPFVDAVVIAMPDHWHAPAAIMALQAGKHVYIEKPGSHNPREGELVAEAARKYGKVVQMGNQRRSWPNVIEALNEIRSGIIGEPHYARTWYGANRPPIGIGNEAPVPRGFSFDLWQGPAPRRAFKDNLVHYNWHWFWPTGNGDLNNQGTHELDVAYWALDSEVANTHPVRVMALGGRFAWNDEGETPNTLFGIAEFANGQYVFFNVRNVNYEGYQREVENRFYFEDGGRLHENTYIPSNGSAPRNVNVREIPITPGGRFGSFIAACRANDPSMVNADMVDAHYSCTLGHLLNISYRLGEKLPFNAKAGRFGDNKLAYQEFMKIHQIMRDGVGIPEDRAEYIVGPWLEFDGESEKFTGERAVEANRLLRDPRRAEFDIPAPDWV